MRFLRFLTSRPFHRFKGERIQTQEERIQEIHSRARFQVDEKLVQRMLEAGAELRKRGVDVRAVRVTK